MEHGIFKYLFSAEKDDEEEDQGDKITDYKCSECNKFFQAKWRLREHKKCHGPQNPCHYPGCNASFKSYRTLITHKRRVHFLNICEEVLERYCRFCGISSTSDSNMKKHIAQKHPHEDNNSGKS